MIEFGDTSDERDEPPDIVHLSEEMYDKVTEGLNVRDLCRTMVSDEKQVRAQAAIFIIMYDMFPLGLSKDEIWEKLNEYPYHLMDDDTFQDLVHNVVLSKSN